MQKQTCQNSFSAVVSIITEGVYGRRRRGTHNLNTSRVFYIITLKEQQNICVSVLA